MSKQKPTYSGVTLIDKSYKSRCVDGVTGVPVGVQPNYQYVRKFYNSRTLHSQPNWRELIARGQDATNNYSVSRLHIDERGTLVAAATGKVLSSGQTLKTDGYLNPTWIVNTSFSYDSDLEDRSISKLKRRLRQEVGDFNLLVPLAELKDLRHTLKGIHQTFEGFGTNWLRRLNKLQFGHGGSLKKHTQRDFEHWFYDSWLNYSFGLAPMVSDFNSIVDAIRAHVKQNRKRVITGSASKSWKESGSSTDNSEIRGVSVTNALTHDCTMGYRHIAGVTHNYGNSSIDDLLYRHFHLGDINSIVPALYELTPWSWLLDYFTTTGRWLDDITWQFPGTVNYVLRNVKVHKDFTCRPHVTAQLDPYTKWVLNYADYNNGRARWYHFERTKLADLPTVALRLKTPGEIADHWFTKSLNLLSIIGSSTGRIKWR